MVGFRLALTLTPHGRLAVTESDDASKLAPELTRRLWEAFSRGTGFGLLHLGAREIGEAGKWHHFSAITSISKSSAVNLSLREKAPSLQPNISDRTKPALLRYQVISEGR